MSVAKPLYGAPCNGCGLCCIMEQCPLSLAIFGTQAVCPALEMGKDAPFRCGIVRAPGEYLDLQPGMASVASEAFGVMLGAGVGCDGIASDADRAAQRADPGMVVDRGRAALKGASPEARALIDFIAKPREVAP